MPKLALNFPRTVGSTTVYPVQNSQPVKLFMVDASIPLYTMFVGTTKFFANAQQAETVIDQLESEPGAPFVMPAWKWEFDGGFDKSIDGRGAKGWQLRDSRSDAST